MIHAVNSRFWLHSTYGSFTLIVAHCDFCVITNETVCAYNSGICQSTKTLSCNP